MVTVTESIILCVLCGFFGFLCGVWIGYEIAKAPLINDNKDDVYRDEDIW